MVKIIDKIKGQHSDAVFSFEFFPPKTDAGVENLYLRMDRMTSVQPTFIDITWGAGGSTKDLTIGICDYAQKYLGVDVLMHLTCTNLKVDDLKAILDKAKELGIQNILALRGDPPRGALAWEPTPGGCDNAIDLVRLVRKEYKDYFCIAVAGFPEGHPQTKGDATDELDYLKAKVDAGADFILTQFFYDAQVFIDFQKRCKDVGIHCPVIPGMMPIQSYSSFQKMTSFCKTRVPDKIWRDLAPIRDDDEQVKAYGVRLCVEMCNQLGAAGVIGFHFYTLNLEKSVMSVLKDLGIEGSAASRRAFPWRGSRSNLKGMSEEVRPINWANRPKSYIKRTVGWDDFPNGRWGDNRSPAYGELSDSHFFRPVEGSKKDLLAMWGEAPITHADVFEVFAKYIEGKIPILPWCETALQSETIPISNRLADINRQGFLTINSQPAVNGEKSDHPLYGWGGTGGRVYQKAYCEFFTSPSRIPHIINAVSNHPNLNFYAIDNNGTEFNGGCKTVTALTWGVFPNKEILQPTIFDHDSFVVWSKEVFELWTSSWASLYDDETDSNALLYEMKETFYLVAIIDNDFIESDLFPFFEEIIELEKQAGSASDTKTDDGDVDGTADMTTESSSDRWF